MNFYITKYTYVIFLISAFLCSNHLFAQQNDDDDAEEMRYPIRQKEALPQRPSERTTPVIDLHEPENSTYDLQYDQETGLVTATRKIGGVNVELPYSMSMEEYQNEKIRQSMNNYWKEKENQNSHLDAEGNSLEEKERNSLLNSKWKVKSELFTSIFGSDQISMKLQGQAKVSIGIQYYKIDNPTLEERYRATTSFDFDESVQVNLQAKIGEKLGLLVNYNTEATFDFENEVKVEYTGNEDDIIQNIEAGNISWNLPGTLIQGSQSLFGFKMDMKFGKMDVTTVFSQKRGETNTITVQNGAMNQEFDIDVTDYDKNRHFFLSHKFKEMYDDALKSLPNVISSITITKIEVWVTNKSGASDNTRNIVAFVDMAETGENLQNSNLWRGNSGAFPSNEANNLYSSMTSNYAAARSISSVTQTMNSISNFKSGRDYEKIENARMLSSSEYTVNEKLGYISLNTALNNNEVLAVAYQYTYRGQTYKVGEFSTSGIDAPQCLYLKLLKGSTLTSSYKNWDLMMKNIYSLGASDIQSDNFDCNVVYLNDSTSTYINYFNEGTKSNSGGLNGLTWLQVMGVDNLNSNLDKSSDGKWDFVDGYTINAYRGLIIFPQREPFGSFIEEKLANQPALAKKYAFTAIYDSTQTYAKQQTSKNKYKIRGSYESKTSNEISLGAFNIAEGSVIVTAGAQVLTENLDYSVDYNMGRVRILNTSILNSGNAINISYEDQSSLNTQTQTMLGVHLNYTFNENINVGATVIHMNEKPLTSKVSYGDESISNTMLGSDVSFSYPLPFLTKWIDALPLITTDAESSIAVEAEIAKLIAGHSKAINAAYIDDFESSSTTYNISSWTSWKIASKPQGQSALFSNAGTIDDLSVGFDRALMAWYTIDPLFLRNTNTTPKHIRQNPEEQSSHYVREVYEEELYPNKESAYGESTNISVLNVAYYPNERGSYNLSTDIDKDGFLNNPEKNWAGIQRKLDYTDFDAQNIEYIQFWMLDPFIYNRDKPNVGGDLYFNVGYISEDVLPDGRKSFEHGLPTPSEEFVVDSTAWAYVPQTASVTNAFNTDPASMYAQDAGLNGMSSDKERYFYNKTSYPYLDMVDRMYNNGEITQTVRDAIFSDPANDDFHYYRGSDYDSQEVGILDRYKRFNMTEGNSRPSEYSTETYSTAAYSSPDNEDLNDDYTLNESESYYQYHIYLHPDSMNVGSNYIADKMQTTVKLKNGKTESVNWYQFKIPLSAPDDIVGDIGDMSSMQFLRMFMTNFTDTCILRFATLELVKGQWRQYTEDLWEDGANPSAATQFETSVVNIEEHDRRSPVNYVLPPGIDRVVDPSNPQLRQLNEQAYALKVVDLGNADARAIYKTLNMDFRNYRRIKMFVHAEALEGYPLEDNQMSLFVRLGTDYEDNYYEYEIPLKLTPYGIYNDGNETDRYIVWPEDNELSVPFTAFTKAKLARNEAKNSSNLTLQDVYSTVDPDNVNNIISIKGNPSLGNVVTMMIGVRSRGAGVHSAEVWVNELRLTEFDEDGGWATRARTTLQLADLGTVSAAGQYSSVGFGSIDQSVLERSMYEYTDFDIAGSFELAKIVSPRARWSIPFYLSYSKSIAKPKYSPYDTDIELSTVLEECETKAERDSIIHISETIEETRSLNFMNVRFKPQPGKRARVWSPSNWSASYSFTETTQSDPDTEYDIWRDISGNISYNFASAPKPIEPLKKSNLNPKYFGLLKSLNFYWQPTLISYRWELVRSYQETQTRNVTNPDYLIPLSVSKDFNWNRYFDFKFNLSRGLRFTLSSSTTARIDEPEGPVNKKLYKDDYKIWRDSIWTNIWHFGRKTTYEHSGDLSYQVPINKLPYLDFLSATAQYKGSFRWIAEALNSDYEWGNTIENGNTKMLSAMSNFGTLYNKSNYLKKIYDKYNFSSSNRRKNNNSESQTVRYTERNIKFERNKEIIIKHNLKTTDITARAYDEKGRGIKGTIDAIDANTASFTPTLDGDNGRVVITGTITENSTPGEVIRDVFMIVLTSLKTISFSYSENNSTVLPGYLPGERFAGFDHHAPTAGFVCGFQDRNFALKAIEHGWVTNDTTLNEPYLMNHSKNLQLRATFEMFKALKVEFSANRSHDNSMSEYYLFNATGFDNVYNTINTGSFSMSICPIKTSGHRPGKTGAMDLDLYKKFLNNRPIIAQRMGQTRAGRTIPSSGQYASYDMAGTIYRPEGNVEAGFEPSEETGVFGYGITSQDVLIPAFLSAYSGGNPNNIFLKFIPKLGAIRPNWNVTFSGLNNIKALKNIVRNIEFSHAYTAKYSIGGYESSLDWIDDGTGMSWIRDLSNNFVPQYEASSVSITEQFSPFLQVSATFINNLTTTVSTGKSRNITLGLASNQVTETYGTDWSINIGYRFDNINFVLGNGKNAKNVNNDLNLTFGLSQRDSYTILRRIEEMTNELTSGTRSTSINFSADYQLTQAFSMGFYYDQTLAHPYISSSYPTNNINVGVSFQLSLSQ